MARYIITADCLELARNAPFVVLPGAEVHDGQMALVDVEGYLIPGRFDGINRLELPEMIIELGDHLDWRVIGPVVVIDPDTAYTCAN